MTEPCCVCCNINRKSCLKPFTNWLSRFEYCGCHCASSHAKSRSMSSPFLSLSTPEVTRSKWYNPRNGVYSLRVTPMGKECPNTRLHKSNTISVRAYWHQSTLDRVFKYIVYSLLYRRSNVMQCKYNVFGYTALTYIEWQDSLDRRNCH